MKPNPPTLRLRRDAGVSLTESMVATALSLVIVSGMLSLFTLDNRVSRDQSDVVRMQSNARNAIEFVARDIATTGYGVTNDSVLRSFGVIYPNAAGDESYTTNAITLWSNTQNIKGTVVKKMPQPSAELVLDSVDGFVEGAEALIIGLGADGSIHYDWFVITQVQDNNGGGEKHLQHAPPTNPNDFVTAYQKGATVLQASRVSYFLQTDAAGISQLMRKVGSAAAYAVADNVGALQFTYYDGASPKVAITPVANATARKKIRSVSVAITADSGRKALDTRKKRTLTLTIQVAPRNVTYLGAS